MSDGSEGKKEVVVIFFLNFQSFVYSLIINESAELSRRSQRDIACYFFVCFCKFSSLNPCINASTKRPL